MASHSPSRGCMAPALPGGGGEHVAADEDFAVVAEADLAAGEGFADGARPMRKGWLRVTRAVVSVMP